MQLIATVPTIAFRGESCSLSKSHLLSSTSEDNIQKYLIKCFCYTCKSQNIIFFYIFKFTEIQEEQAKIVGQNMQVNFYFLKHFTSM